MDTSCEHQWEPNPFSGIGLYCEECGQFKDENGRRDIISELCQLIKNAGLTMTLYGKPVEETELRTHATEAAAKRISGAIASGMINTMKTKKKLDIVYQVKVDYCDEFKCPFFHAGIMGQLSCTVANRDVTEYRSEKPPDWCPLRTNPIKVTI